MAVRRSQPAGVSIPADVTPAGDPRTHTISTRCTSCTEAPDLRTTAHLEGVRRHANVAYVITAHFSGPAGHRTGAKRAPAAVPSAAPPIDVGATKSHWLLAGFVGSNFGSSATDQSVAFGGQLAYSERRRRC